MLSESKLGFAAFLRLKILKALLSDMVFLQKG